MKKKLEKHVLNILSTLKLEESFEVYDCRIDILPDWIKQIQITHEYLILVKDLANGEKLQKFLRREIYQHENVCYWFDGDEFTPNSKQNIISFITPEPSNINELTLPDWLDSFLFDELGARYAPDYVRYV